MAIRLISGRATVVQWIGTCAAIVAAALVPPLFAFALLKINLPTRGALDGVLGSWRYLRDSQITNNLFYRRVLGTDQLQHNLVAMLWVVGGDLVILLPPAILALSIRHRATNETKWVCSLGSAAYVILLLAIFWDQADWHGAMRPLNVVAIAGVVAFAIDLIRHRKALPPRIILQLAFSVFALALLSKTFFNIAIFHYGFALSGPAFTLLVLSLIHWLPNLIHRAGGTGWILRAAGMAALGCFCTKYLVTYQIFYRSHPAPIVGAGDDEFGVYQNADAINITLNFLEQLPPGQTVATLPQGAMINYLSRRINPTGELLLLPGEVDMFGEKRIFDRFRQHPPDWVVAVQTNVAMYGSRGFGVDYAQDLVRFIKDNYDPVTLTDPARLKSPLHMLKFDPGHRLLHGASPVWVPATLPSPAANLPVPRKN